jgi:hypothetical protein
MRATPGVDRGEPRHEIALQPPPHVSPSQLVNIDTAVQIAVLHDQTIEAASDIKTGPPRYRTPT